jgi:hypothetical protein
MERETQKSGPFIDRVDKKELKMITKVTGLCSGILDEIEVKMKANSNQYTFRSGYKLIICNQGRAGGFYHGRFATVCEIHPGHASWRKITVINDNGKEFPFTQIEEEFNCTPWYTRTEIRGEIGEDLHHHLEEQVINFAEEVKQWIPITLPLS